jgi:ribosomal protein L11 methyltransferase
MLKFSSQIPPSVDGNALGDFLEENGLLRWTVEMDCEDGQNFLCGYVDGRKIGEKEFSTIREKFGDLANAAVAEIGETEWVNAYKESAEPWQCENLLWIPSFMEDEVEVGEDEIAVYIDPGMAFGSGSHETTRLCARAMVMYRTLYEKTGDLIIKDCMDVGCGSGILGISALKLGLVHATFIDNDRDAIRISGENASANGLYPDQMDFIVADFGIGLLGRQTDLLMANVTADALIANADVLVASVRSGGLLCLSGILREERSAVAGVFGKHVHGRWETVVENGLDDGNWTSLIYFRA